MPIGMTKQKQIPNTSLGQVRTSGARVPDLDEGVLHSPECLVAFGERVVARLLPTNQTHPLPVLVGDVGL